MSVHPNLQELELYRRGHLPPVELLELDAHVSACSECQARMSPHLRTLQDAVMGAAGQHLSYDLMERYFEGCLDETTHRSVDAHTAVCEECSEQLRDFFSIADELARPVNTVYAAAAAPPARLTLWKWLRQPRYAFALSALVLMICLAPFVWRDNRPGSSSRLDKLDLAGPDLAGHDRRSGLDRIPQPRRGRVQELLEGHGSLSNQVARSMSQLSPDERSEWASLSAALANDPVVLAAVDMDFGLYCDADRLLQSQSGADSRRLRMRAASLCPGQ
jgi:hypothetical protein